MHLLVVEWPRCRDRQILLLFVIQHLYPHEPKHPHWHHDDQKLTDDKPLNLWIHCSKPAEISEPHLREDMDLEAPMPLTSELQAEGMAINKPH